jgi:hypothetical protein
MDWWKHYLNGEICRRLDTPMQITSTMEDWFDGAESAMRKFVAHQPVTPSKLLAEVEYCMTQNTLGANEQNRLIALRAWVLREADLAESAKAFREASASLIAAMSDVGLSPYFAGRIVTEAQGVLARQ